ncbi:uncharacterized protein LOC142343045 [Convolutriloba macropyga]|uniref:uncharacterized protein LOC142343045 n=1 Tax=Convolutriloba macropyga TaxID=536237 RepID=UPI003F51BC4B
MKFVFPWSWHLLICILFTVTQSTSSSTSGNSDPSHFCEFIELGCNNDQTLSLLTDAGWTFVNDTSNSVCSVERPTSNNLQGNVRCCAGYVGSDCSVSKTDDSYTEEEFIEKIDEITSGCGSTRFL